MRFEHDGIALWYGTSDASAPEGTVPAGQKIAITIAVQPADASNRVEVQYRINQETVSQIPARYLRNAPARQVQYFRANLPLLRPGDEVDYRVICRCAGRQVPPPEEVEGFTSTLRGTEVGDKPAAWSTFKVLPLEDTGLSTEIVGKSRDQNGYGPKADPPLSAASERAVTGASTQIITTTTGQKPTKVVFGSITFKTPITTDIRVQAFDKDMRSEERLGTVLLQGPFSVSATYKIAYTEAQFRRSEKRRADLIVRASTVDGRFSGESDIVFNAGDQEHIDLTLESLPTKKTPRLSELEKLQESIEPVRESVEYRLFTDDDLVFLTEETIRRGILGIMQRPIIRKRLEFLRLAAQFAHDTGILLAAFYGWFRQDLPTELDALLDLPLTRLQAALEAAIKANIIPDISGQIPDILDLMRSLRFERGRLVTHRFVAQLIDAATEQTLSNRLISVVDLDAALEEQNQDSVTTDGQGIFVLNFTLPKDAPEDTTRRLQLTIRDEDRTLAVIEINAIPNQTEVAEIRVDIQPNEQEQTAIRGVISASLSERLENQGIKTFGDLLANRDLTDNNNPDELDRLRAMAKWTVLAPNLNDEARTYLLNNGLRSLWDAARIPRAEFVSTHHEHLGGDAATYAFFKASLDTVKLFQHQLSETWIRLATSPDDEEEDPDIPTGVKETLDSFKKCGCKDCDSAVSPAAYLAHLLDWVLLHVKDNDSQIQFADLEEDLHQPFGDLPASCEAVEEEVRQVRLVVEALWSFTGLRDQTDLQMPFSFRKSYRYLRNQLYQTILTNLGTSFEQLRRATLPVTEDTPTVEIVISQRQTVAKILGIDELQHLSELFFNVEQPPISPSEDELEQLFGYQSTRRNPFENKTRPDLITWQRERLESIWQTQDWVNDAYSGDERLPFIDPVLINQSYLRTPLEDNPAFPLLTSRQEALTTHRQAMVDSVPQAPGLTEFEALLTGELEQPIAQLQTLFATLESSTDRAELEATRAALEELNLTLAGFTHLMDIHSRLVNGEALGASESEIDAAWEAVFDILSRSHRHSLFSTWVEQENANGIILSPKFFWMSVEPIDSPNPWQANRSERDAWEHALQNRSQPPIIDPEQIPLDYIRILSLSQDGNQVAVMPPLDTVQLWEERRTFIDSRIETLQSARQGQPTLLDALEAMLVASNTDITVEVLVRLRNLETEGQDIGPHLAQLKLSPPAYRFLADIHLLAETGSNISGDRWDAVEAILVQSEKHLEFTEWRTAEQNLDITLHPDRFELSSPPEEIADSSVSEWLHDPRALTQWVATLEARQEQFKALEAALATAVSNAEEQVLPLLRNSLIMQVPVSGTSLADKATQVDGWLLMDMFMDGCQMTTRVSHAIETLQRLVRGVYTSEHIEPLQHLTLDAVEDYETEWPVIGSYATWRAFMLAYLFPENLLHVIPPPRESYGLAQLKKNLPRRPSPKQACEAAAAYADYYQDMCTLEVQASCQVNTRVATETKCEATTSTLRSLVHVFALASNSNKVYTATFDSRFDKKDTLSTWCPVSKLNNVVEIIGAVPHYKSQGRDFILLFVKVRRKAKIQFVRYDLDTFSCQKDELDLPPGTLSFSAVAIQKWQGRKAPSGFSGVLAAVMSTVLVIRASNGRIFMRTLNASATDWSLGSETWKPLVGDLLSQQFVEVCALIQIERNRLDYLLIVRDETDKLLYRILSNKDDGKWRQVGTGKFLGAFSWPDTSDVFVFWWDSGKTKFRLIQKSDSFKSSGTKHTDLDGFLKNIAGVDLRNFRVSGENFQSDAWGGSLTVYEVIRGGLEPEVEEKDLDPPRNMPNNLYDLMFLNVLRLNWGENSELVRNNLNTVQHWVDKIRKSAYNRLIGKIEGIKEVSFLDEELGQWKLADSYVREFSIEHKSLIKALKDLFEENEETWFVERNTSNEKGAINIATTERWQFVPSGGHEESRKAIVLQKSDGAFRLRLQRENNNLSTPGLRRITLNDNGPYDLAPLSTKEDLQLRRSEIKEMYLGNKDAPPSVQIYLKEAYNLVPVYLGFTFALQRSDVSYEEALLWYRQVFDYLYLTCPKIDYSLKQEEKLALDYNSAEDFFDDANNSHAIAATRKNSYTRQILLLIIRCLIDYADALFARNNVTDNARARELYTLALKLLDLKLLKPGKSKCENIIGELEIDLVAASQPPFRQFKVALEAIQDKDILSTVVGQLRTFSLNTRPSTVERLGAIRKLVTRALSEIPKVKSQSDIRETKQATFRTLENQFLASASVRTLLQKTQRQRHQVELSHLAAVASSTTEALPGVSLPWLRQPKFDNDDCDQNGGRVSLALLNPEVPRRLAVLSQIPKVQPLTYLTATQRSSFAINTGISFDFCIPQNPVMQALRRRAENNLTKLRTCRNIAGFIRQLDPYGAPIGIGSGLVSADGTIFSGIVDAPATPYRYAALITRAKELVNIAQQIEASYQAALENAERDDLSRLQAEQSVELTSARVTLQDLQVNQANNALGLARLQKGSAVLRQETYAGWIAAGKNEHEEKMLAAYEDALAARAAANAAKGTAEAAGIAARIVGDTRWIVRLFKQGAIRRGLEQSALLAQQAATLAATVETGKAIDAEARAQKASFEASFERRNDEWQLQQGLAAIDVQIGDQQIQLARDGVAIAQQARVIAGLEHTHAADVLEFLLSKTFTGEMYRWIASVLEDVYRYFLQEAASIAHLAERQLAFERQQGSLKVIQPGYWNVPVDSSEQADNVDRLGLTGSARLLKDIYQLDQYAFETRQRKQSLSITLDLAEVFPFEFQQFRETGVLVFETPQSLIDRQFPGYYLCLIQQVTVSVVALVPPTYGIRASLTSAGISQTVVGGDTFQTITLRQLPERLALTAPTTTSIGEINLEPDAQSLQRPFEGTGFATQWELRMPKANNLLDYNTMATVLFTVQLTALHSFDYEHQVLEQLDRNISANRAFRFRNELADAWYDLNNPDLTANPMTVRFQTRREDFPPNIEELRIQHVLLYFIRSDDTVEEIPVEHLHFTQQGSNGVIGGGSATIDGVISTRRGNGTSWLPMIGQTPFGDWELTLPDDPGVPLPNGRRVRDLFQEELIEDMLLVITYQGNTPEWPQ